MSGRVQEQQTAALPTARLTPEHYLRAARVPETLRPQSFGPWIIERQDVRTMFGHVCKPSSIVALHFMAKVGFTSYTLLHRHSLARMHLRHGTDVVMEDSWAELQQHLPIWLRAKGRVLVTGLGLGCVVRGLLANPEVTHVDVIEIDKSILRVVGHEFVSNPRVTLFLGDALTYHIPHRLAYDYAWHDLWTDGDDHLEILHSRLIARFRRRARVQGAWKLHRFTKRLMRRNLRIIG